MPNDAALDIPVSLSAAYSARPTLRLEGQEDADASARLHALTMRDDEQGLASLELRLEDWRVTTAGPGFAFDGGSPWALGAAVQVECGAVGEQARLFAGHVTALERIASRDAPPEFVVLAEDRLARARFARRSATYADTSLGDVVERVASRLGLTVRAEGIPSVRGTWVQLNESDLAFLRRLLRRFDCGLRIVGEELRVERLRPGGANTIALALGQRLRQARVTADLAHQATQTTYSGWDAVQGQPIIATSMGAAMGNGAGATGAAILVEKFTMRSEHLSAFTCADAAEARALADAAFDQRARAFVRLRGISEGDAALVSGVQVEIEGLGTRFDNVYHVTSTVHRFDMNEGYRTEFSAECARLARP
jgi:phage protein D